ncbi:MAG: hypothetical protein WBP81_07030 [Solirubrobacteraceae bacterium]
MQVLDEARPQPPDWQRPVLRHAVGVAGAGQEIAELDAVFDDAVEHGNERGRRVGVAAGEQHAPHELWHLGAFLVFDDCGGLQVVAEERLVLLAGSVAASTPPGGLRIGAVPALLWRSWLSIVCDRLSTLGVLCFLRGGRDQVSWSVQSMA